jgi:uncharacterized protein (TIGR03067 family)
MSHIFLIAFSAFVAFCVAAQDEKPTSARDQASKQELQRIQGSWQFESLQENGERVSEADLKDRTIFFGGEAFLVKQGEEFLQAGTQKLDPSKSPKTINAMIAQGDRKGDILLGIYELNGDTFKVCFDTEGEKRPADFRSENGSGNILAVYKRRQSGDDPKPNITGEYTSVVPGPNGTEITADVDIEKRGDAYLVTWKRNNATISTGIGMRKDDTLSVSWRTQGQSGVAVYQIEKDHRLVGQYTTFGGIGLLAVETLTPKRKID